MKVRIQRLPVALRRGLLVAAALSMGACADTLPAVDGQIVATPDRTPTTTPTTTPTAAAAKVAENLEALSSLALFEVGELLTYSSRSGGNCYGYPCENEREATSARLATELERLVGLTADLAPSTTTCDATSFNARAEANLAVLDGLNIIEIGEFLRVAPANQAVCYNLPCPEDLAAAKAANCDKLGRLEALADRAAVEFNVSPAPRFGALSAGREIQVANDLSSLNQLQIFEVGALVVFGAPSNCYVCPAPDDALTGQADRLAEVAATARDVLGNYRQTDAATFAGCDLGEAEAALASLAALNVFEVGALIQRDAAGEGLCYRGGCTDANEAEAEALTCRRVDAAQRLVEATKSR